MDLVPHKPDDPIDTLVVIVLVVTALVLATIVGVLEWAGVLPLDLR